MRNLRRAIREIGSEVQERNMTRHLTAVFIVSLATIALHVWGERLLGVAMRRGDNSDWGHVAKQATYRYFNGGKP